MELEKLQSIRGKAGIYALIKCGELAYVGSSGNMYIRVLEHNASNKIEFDNHLEVISYEEAPHDLEELRIVEMGIICTLKPKDNKLVFDNFREWVYSLPHKNYKKDEIDYFESVVNQASKYINGELS